MIVSEIMSTELVTVHPDTPFREIWKQFFSNRIHTIPVVDKHTKLLGIISRADLLRPLYPQYQNVLEYLQSSRDFEDMEGRVNEMEGKTAKDLMSTRVIFTREDTLIMRVLSRMIVRKVDQLPVLTYEDRVVGVVTKGDIFYSLFKDRLRGKKSSKKAPIQQKIKKQIRAK